MADDAARTGETIEFGAVADDEPTASAGAIPWPSDGGTERVELDLSGDWADEETSNEAMDAPPAIHIAAAQRQTRPVQGTSSARPKGLRIVEDVEKMQVVIDPYQSLGEDDE